MHAKNISVQHGAGFCAYPYVPSRKFRERVIMFRPVSKKKIKAPTNSRHACVFVCPEVTELKFSHDFDYIWCCRIMKGGPTLNFVDQFFILI